MKLYLLVALLPIALAGVLRDIKEGLDNPMENPDLFEGDIDLDDVPGPEMFRVAAKLTVLENAANRWNNAKIPYVIDAAFTPAEQQKIERAMLEIETKTAAGDQLCIHFQPRNAETYYIKFNKGTGCHSGIGRSSNPPNFISLGNGCVTKGTAMHEIIHSLGFWHMQSRTDRDKYVTVNWDNIKEDQQHNFNKYNQQTLSYLGLPYDYASIMHYGPNAFSSNGKPTMVALNPVAGSNIGQRNAMSPVDIAGIQRLYGCPVTQGPQQP